MLLELPLSQHRYGCYDCFVRLIERQIFCILPFVLVGCGPGTVGQDDQADELGSSESSSTDEGESSSTTTSTDESESSSTTDEPSGPENDPEAPLDCWEPLGDASVRVAWGTSTEQLLLATLEGVVRVEGDELTTLGAGDFYELWATDLHNGWLARDLELVRLVDGTLEPWPSLGIDIGAIGGLGPADVWVSGYGDEGEGLFRFDGSAWTPVDVLQTFGTSTTYSPSMIAVGDVLYLAPWDGPLATWDGTTGSLAPSFPDGWESAWRLSTRDGERVLAWAQWCDFECFTAAYELGVDGWVDAPMPQFDDWEVDTIDYHADPLGGVWGLVRNQYDDPDHHLRVARYHDGAWQRARTPDADNILVVSDGIVSGNHRATSACLFGD